MAWVVAEEAPPPATPSIEELDPFRAAEAAAEPTAGQIPAAKTAATETPAGETPSAGNARVETTGGPLSIEAALAAPAAPAGAETILLVEDETALRGMVARYLRGLGYVVLEAECGEDALEILGDEDVRIDLMLSDVVMPGIDGPSVLRQLGARRPELRTIFMTATPATTSPRRWSRAPPSADATASCRSRSRSTTSAWPWSRRWPTRR